MKQQDNNPQQLGHLPKDSKIAEEIECFGMADLNPKNAVEDPEGDTYLK